MFNKKIFIYLSKTHLFIYFKELNQPLRIEFEPTTIMDLERVNSEWIRVRLDALLEKINLKNAVAVLVVSKDLVFDKIINEESLEEKFRETTDFIEHIPLPSNVIVHKEFIKDDNTLITATCRDVYEAIIALFEEHSVVVESVLPEVVFNKIDFTKAFLSDLFKQKELLEFGNFLDSKNSKRHADTKFIVIVVILILVFGALLGLGAYLLNQNNNSNFELPKFPEKSLTSLEESAINLGQNVSNTSPSAQNNTSVIQNTAPAVTPVALDSISVEIFNGTGIPGFASQIAKIINDLGFKNTSTANADKFDYTNTIIETSPDIPEEIVSSIRDGLKSKFKSFEIKKSLVDPKTIRITTGEVAQN